MDRDQQRHSAPPRAFDVTVESPRGHWSGKTTDLSPSGAKVTLEGNAVRLPLMTVIQLRISPPDGDPPISLPARVIETDSDGVILSFFNLREQAQRGLKDLLDSVVLREAQVLLEQSGSNGSERHASPQSSMPPGFLDDTRPAEGAAAPKGAEPVKPSAVEEPQRAEPEERPVPPSDVRAEGARLQELLGKAGLDGLSLPSNGVLSPQWRKFLDQLGPKASSGSTGTRSSRSAKTESSNAARSRGDKSRTSR